MNEAAGIEGLYALLARYRQRAVVEVLSREADDRQAVVSSRGLRSRDARRRARADRRATDELVRRRGDR